MSIYPEYEGKRSLFVPQPGKLPGLSLEIATDKRFTKLLTGEDPFNIERSWIFCGARACIYGRGGIVTYAFSGVGLAL